MKKYAAAPTYVMECHTDCIIYRFVTGETAVVREGMQGVTSTDIQHVLMNEKHEACRNRVNNDPTLTQEDKKKKRRWQLEHPGMPFPGKKRIPLDIALCRCGCWDTCFQGHKTTAADRMREIISGLPPRMRTVYRLCLISGVPQSEASAMLHISLSRLRKDVRTIRYILASDRILRSYFRSE